MKPKLINQAPAPRPDVLLDIGLDLIDEPSHALRDHMDLEALKELAEDVRRFGVRQPLKVRPKGKRYEILTGHRRFLAARAAESKTVPCVVVYHQDIPVAAERWRENLFRQDLNPADEAQVLAHLFDKECSGDVDKLCAMTGLSVAYINNRMELLRGHPVILAAVKRGDMSLAVARELNKYKNERYQNMRIADAIAQNWTWRQASAAYHEDMRVIGAQPEMRSGEPEGGGPAPQPATYRLECICCGTDEDPHLMEVVHMHKHCKRIVARAYAAGMKAGLEGGGGQ